MDYIRAVIMCTTYLWHINTLHSDRTVNNEVRVTLTIDRVLSLVGPSCVSWRVFLDDIWPLCQAVLLLIRSVVGLSAWRIGIDSRPYCGICGGQSDTVTVFLPTLQFSPVSIIPPLLHTHSSIYHPHCIMFFSQNFSFPLSVPFHHCSTLIHPSTTHTV